MTEPKFIVMLAAYNGAGFLDEQLDTIEHQSFGRIDLRVSDDGSADGTADLVTARAGRWGRGSVTLTRGPGRGFAENFRALLTSAPSGGDYYAFSDQDDLWDPDKFARAHAALAGLGDAPAIWCGRTRTVDRAGRPTGLSPLFPHPPAFRNALVQSLAGANTMVMNARAFALVAEASRRTGFLTHDWWAYLLVTGAGGQVIYTPDPAVSYRQHEANLVGENNSWAARLVRLRGLLAGRFRRYTDQNIASLGACLDLLAPENRALFQTFRESRAGGPLQRLRGVTRTGAFRQTGPGQAGLYAAALLGLL